jgi:hypothetical protein
MVVPLLWDPKMNTGLHRTFPGCEIRHAILRLRSFMIDA